MGSGSALEGIRVLDLSRLLPGPFATAQLRDLGATVDKLEPPGAGDYLRRIPPLVDGLNPVFRAINYGKRSIVLDLKDQAGRDAFERLVPRYDVLVSSFRPGVLDRLGLGFERLTVLHPGLISCMFSGYGADGEGVERAGHDLTYAALAGILGLTGPEEGPPTVPGVQVADFGSALFAVGGILAALLERHRTGHGQPIEVSLCESAVAFAAYGLVAAQVGPPTAHGRGVLTGGIAPYGTYTTKDGRAVALAALEPKFWDAFCRGVGIGASAEALLPGAHQLEWRDRLRSLFASRTRDEWIEFAQRHDCCLEPVLTPEEVFDHPLHRSRGTFLGLPCAGGDPLRVPRFPIGAPEPAPVPAMGEHGEEILREAGFAEAEIRALVPTRS